MPAKVLVIIRMTANLSLLPMLEKRVAHQSTNLGKHYYKMRTLQKRPQFICPVISRSATKGNVHAQYANSSHQDTLLKIGSIFVSLCTKKE
ncbi:hypothetical protein CEXT_135691 [Caerostris extrusa]|uniref:Uncharacterized protein n=1 Tax=Caerostris extrusa TaxID=172846 RepID=A0AAV4QGH7_CAEEX|nr:hypothetical protein CEXT_135691 [Caerostris extrusa]